MKYSIKIFARVRPIKKAVGVSDQRSIPMGFSHCMFLLTYMQLYEVGEADSGVPTISFIVPRSESSGYVNNKKELFAFK